MSQILFFKTMKLFRIFFNNNWGNRFLICWSFFFAVVIVVVVIVVVVFFGVYFILSCFSSLRTKQQLTWLRYLQLRQISPKYLIIKQFFGNERNPNFICKQMKHKCFIVCSCNSVKMTLIYKNRWILIYINKIDFRTNFTLLSRKIKIFIC